MIKPFPIIAELETIAEGCIKLKKLNFLNLSMNKFLIFWIADGKY